MQHNYLPELGAAVAIIAIATTRTLAMMRPFILQTDLDKTQMVADWLFNFS